MLELNHLSEIRKVDHGDDINDYFQNVESSFKVIESKTNSALKEVFFDMAGVSGMATCNDKFLTGSYFPNYKKKVEGFELRRGCDGMLLTTLMGKENYLVLIELKSNSGDALSDAPYQIAASYIKAMSFFRSYSTFVSDSYKVFAIILYTEHGLQQSENENVMERRKTVVSNSENPGTKYSRLYKNDLKSNKAVDFLMNGEDFGSDQLHLNPAIVMHDLPVHVRCVDHPNASFDLLPFLEGL